MQNYSPTQKRTLAVALISTACMVLGGSSVSPLIPALASKFQQSLTTTSWILTIYCIPGIIFVPIAGLLADRYGRKVVLLPSFFLFCIAGSACALTDSFNTLLFCRFLQGIGEVAMGMLNTTILGDAFHGKELSQVIGSNLASLTVCTALYPALVGIIAPAITITSLKGGMLNSIAQALEKMALKKFQKQPALIRICYALFGLLI